MPDSGAEVGASLDISTTAPHDARVYDYLLGGVIHVAVPREAAEAATVEFPGAWKAPGPACGPTVSS
jgi:hypothetical protein